MDAQAIARFEEHQGRSVKHRIALRPGIVPNGDDIIRRDVMTVDSAVNHITGHQFGETGRVTLLVFITRS
ncbi:hypothetical protein D3C81_2108630 [compost metagenome]